MRKEIANQDARARAELRAAEVARFLQETERLSDESKMRRDVSAAFFSILKWWLRFMGAILVAQIVLHACGLKGLSDALLIAMLTTTTVAIIGLMLAVARYLFPGEIKTVLPPLCRAALGRQSGRSSASRQNASVPR